MLGLILVNRQKETVPLNPGHGHRNSLFNFPTHSFQEVGKGISVVLFHVSANALSALPQQVRFRGGYSRSREGVLPKGCDERVAVIGETEKGLSLDGAGRPLQSTNLESSCHPGRFQIIGH